MKREVKWKNSFEHAELFAEWKAVTDMMKVQRDMDHLAKHIESTFNEYLVEMLYNNRIPVMLLQHKTSIYEALKRFFISPPSPMFHVLML